MQDAELDVVIVTFNSAAVLGGLLDTLWIALADLPNARVIVADNDSRDDSAGIARDHAIGASVVSVGYNAGYSAGINAAVAAFGRSGPLLLLNADIRLRPDCISRMLAELARPEVGVVVPKTLHDDGTLSYSIRREPSLLTAWSEALVGGGLAGRLGLGEISRRAEDYAQNRAIIAASGAIMLVSSSARAGVGPWDERYFLYSEEVDYQRRARDAGFEIRLAANAVCTHVGGESNSNATLFALLTANRMRYFRRYHGSFATLLFRLAVTTGAGLRFMFGPTHRAAFKAAWMTTAEVARLVPSPRAAAALLKEL
jgi:GT2 family glycosyltransferase